MTNAVFLAPLIRGALLDSTQCPWAVRSTGKTSRADASLRIRVENSAYDEKKTAAAIKKAFDSVRKKGIPACVEIVFREKSEFFLTAADMCSLENAEKNKTGFWPFPPNMTEHSSVSRNDIVKNKVALVTGGAQGFGEELVRGLIKQEAIVYIADLNIDGAQKLANSLNAETKKQSAFAVKVNVCDEQSVQELFDTIALTSGALDICISNAGVLRAASILEQDIASFRFVTDINYTAFAIVSKYSAILMKRQYNAAPSWATDIIQINSKSGLEGSNKNGSYAGSKFGSIGLVESFALELVSYGIKVNAICPGNFFDGPLWSNPEKGLFVQYLKTGKVPGAKTIQDVRAFYEKKVPMNRGCCGEDVLKAVLYLVEQKYETGQALPVTGGQVMLH